MPIDPVLVQPLVALVAGILLFATELSMLFGHRPALQGPERGTAAEGDVAVFPLAIPLLSGPGAIATVLLLASEAGRDSARLAVLVLATALVFALSWLILRVSERLMVRLGAQRIAILTRVLGIVLAALAVQYVLDGVSGYYEALVARR